MITLLPFLVCFGIPIILYFFISIKMHKNLQVYWSRHCMGPAWRKLFPDTPKEDIRRFLDLFITAFDFKKNRRLKFKPEDRIMDVYHAIYFDKSMADACELEEFCQLMNQTYGVDLIPQWREDLTFGDIFEMARKQNAPPAH